MRTAPWSRPRPYLFENLSSFTRKEVALWNWYIRVGPGETEWKSWVAEIFGHLLERPSGLCLQLVQTHLVDAQFGEKVLSFGAREELFIGRGLDNDVVLAANAIANRNTRLALKGGRLQLEDLGGKLGTYLWDKKLQTGEPHSVQNGDQFTVFPYRFRVMLERCWTPETDVALSECHLKAVDRAEFSQLSPPGWRVFTIDALPCGEKALLEVSPIFLTKMQRRILGPLGLDQVRDAVPSDDALTAFILLALLERLNRRLKFPVQFSLGRGSRNTLTDTTRGMLLSFAVGAADVTGHFRVFLPLQFLAKCQPDRRNAPLETYPAKFSWNFPVSAGFVDLSAEEIAQIGLGDILVAQRAPAALFPGDFCKGWTLVDQGSNSTSFRIDKYFERGVSVDGRDEAGSKPDIEALPLRLHVILDEREFTLADIQSLTPGMIIELAATKTDPVRLMVNGKMLGEGELVDVEGNLAVKVLRWRSA
jgi:type III secretion system YscQ/HrcQ family protein